MSNVLKHGSTYPQEYIVTCENCGCVYTYTEKDLRTIITWKEKEENGTTCPECGNETEHFMSEKFGGK